MDNPNINNEGRVCLPNWLFIFVMLVIIFNVGVNIIQFLNIRSLSKENDYLMKELNSNKTYITYMIEEGDSNGTRKYIRNPGSL